MAPAAREGLPGVGDQMSLQQRHLYSLSPCPNTSKSSGIWLLSAKARKNLPPFIRRD